MAITAGDFSASDLREAFIKADNMWGNDMTRADYEADVDIWNAIRAEQNANVSLLEEAEDKDVKVYWSNMCNETDRDCASSADDCDLSGNELGSDSKTYTLGYCREWSFSVNEMIGRTNKIDMQELVAKGFLKADFVLSNGVASRAIPRIEANKGTNVVTTGIGTVNGGTTETDIAAANFNERAFPYMYRVAIQNKLGNPFLLSGENLFEERIIALQDEANGEGKGNAARYKMMRTYYDLFNIDPANAPNLKTYMINRGTIAFAHRHYYGETPIVYNGAGQSRYSIASRNLAEVRWDVFYTNRCVGKEIIHDWKFTTKYDYLFNPTGCDAGRTGILAFNRV